MGTWDDGLLDNDTACDALGTLCDKIVRDIQNAEATETRCAAVGVLLQLSPYKLGLDSASGPLIAAAVKAHAKQIEKLDSDVRGVMQLVMDGKGKELAEQRDPSGAAYAGILNSNATKSHFGERHAALFASPAGAAYVQSIADRCIETIEGELADEDSWCDLCREVGSMGLVGVLLAIAPYCIPISTIESWRAKARQGIGQLRDCHDDELDFHEGYYANLDRAFDVLAARFAAREES
jgi:hypothetical protein